MEGILRAAYSQTAGHRSESDRWLYTIYCFTAVGLTPSIRPRFLIDWVSPAGFIAQPKGPIEDKKPPHMLQGET